MLDNGITVVVELSFEATRGGHSRQFRPSTFCRDEVLCSSSDPKLGTSSTFSRFPHCIEILHRMLEELLPASSF